MHSKSMLFLDHHYVTSSYKKDHNCHSSPSIDFVFEKIAPACYIWIKAMMERQGSMHTSTCLSILYGCSSLYIRK